MNYILQINAFFDHEKYIELRANSIVMYFSLLHINNQCGWKERFSASQHSLMHYSRIEDKNTFYRAIKQLVEYDFISWDKSNNQYSASIYSLKVLYENLSKHSDGIGTAQGQHSDGIGTLPKQEKQEETIKQEDLPESSSGEENLEQTKKPEKEGKRKIPPKEKEPSIFIECREFFKSKDPEFYFDPKEAGNLKSLIAKIRFGATAFFKREATDQEILDGFKNIVLHPVKWQIENNKLSITDFNSQYDSIRNSLKNGNGTGQPRIDYAARRAAFEKTFGGSDKNR